MNKQVRIGVVVCILCTLVICIRFYPKILDPQFYELEDLACKDKILEYITTETRMDLKVRDLLIFSVEHIAKKSVQAGYLLSSNTQDTLFSDSNILQRRIEKTLGSNHNKNVSIAICSYQGNTAQYIQEWLSHYILLGVSKFYIYSNFADRMEGANLQRVLKPFIDLGYVKLIPFSGNSQLKATDECVKDTRKHDWVGFIDVDEYLTFNNQEWYATNYLSKFKDAHNDVGAIALIWRTMHVTGVPVYNPHKTMYEQSRYELLPHENQMKLFVNTRALINYMGVHKVTLKANYGLYDASGRKLSEMISVPSNYTFEQKYEVLELRHFWGFSFEYTFFDKVCGSGDERVDHMGIRIRIALLPFLNTTQFELLEMPKHQPILNNFLYEK